MLQEIQSDFQIVTTSHSLLLVSKNPLFLKEKWDMIAAYTKKVDPFAKLEKYHIKSLPLENYCINLHKVLPRLLSALYGDNDINREKGNCHGASLVASGLSPFMTTLDSPFDLSITVLKTNQISLSQLSSGDLVFLKSGPLGSHSFVYLDQDLSFSMNGVGEPFELQRTEEVLHTYGFSANALIEYPKNFEKREIVVLRKQETWVIPEPLISHMINFYRGSKKNLIRIISLEYIKKELINLIQTSNKASEMKFLREWLFMTNYYLNLL